MKTTLKAYKNNMGTNHKSFISKGTKYDILNVLKKMHNIN